MKGNTIYGKMEFRMVKSVWRTNAVTKHWLFDYDSKQGVEDFLKEIPPEINRTCTETVNGFAVVVEHGFDTREILTHFPYVTLKRDAKLCYAWMRKEQK